jgi:hypothetical protein
MSFRAPATDSYTDPRTALTVLKYGTAAAFVVFATSACATAGAVATPVAAAPETSTNDIVPSADLCRFLKTELPQLKAAGSEVGARSLFTTDVFELYQRHSGAIPDGTRMDAQTKQNCPDLRTETLKVTGSDDFAAI